MMLDFEWIIEILFDLSKVSGLSLGSKLSDLIIDINLRVPDVREFTVSQIVNIYFYG
jgi:AP-3 complex subunit delta-1